MNKPLFNKVCIVGVGLIGGSLGLAIKKKALAKNIFVRPHRVKNNEHMKLLQAVGEFAGDEEAKDIDVIGEADLIILAMPILTNIAWIKQKHQFIKPSAIVMDVGSTKSQIQFIASEYLKKGQFVGCHPMAGSHRKGLKFAKADIFKNSICFITSPNQKIEEMWKVIGAKPVKLTAEEHDAWAARVSHLPHVLAFSLLRQIFRAPKAALLNSIGFLNPSFKEFVRLSKSDSRIWADILLSNKNQILSSLGDLEKDMLALKKIFRNKSSGNIHSSLMRFISQANEAASRLMPDED